MCGFQDRVDVTITPSKFIESKGRITEPLKERGRL